MPAKNRLKDEIEQVDNKLDMVRIPDLIMAVCSPEYKDESINDDKTHNSVEDKKLIEEAPTGTLEKQNIEFMKKKSHDRHRKSSKEVQVFTYLHFHTINFNCYDYLLLKLK